MNLPYPTSPLAYVGPQKTPCTKLAMIYTKPFEGQDAGEQPKKCNPGGGHEKPAKLQRKISQSLFHENLLLQKMKQLRMRN